MPSAQNKPSSISGFTLVRNAVKLDYPFRESVLSVLPLCDEIVINVGDSNDGTLEICESLVSQYPGKIRLIHSVWERRGQEGGYQLRHQTEQALQKCTGDWCLYIQADEVLHEDDHLRIRQAITAADSDLAIDGIVFDYLHFYGNYRTVATGRIWYRREVRAFKNHRGILPFRDAQGFRKSGKKLVVLPANASVFHYGHVRTCSGLQVKSQEMTQWWGKPPETRAEQLIPYRHFGLKVFRKTHPSWMKVRVAKNDEFIDPFKRPRKWDKNEFKNLINLIFETVFRYRIGEFRNYRYRRLFRRKLRNEEIPLIGEPSLKSP